MLHTLVLLAMAVAAAVAQGVTAPIAPSGSYPDGCAKAFDGTMWISVLSVNAVQKRGVIQERGTECTDGNLVITLADGVLTDAKGRTGYIASNYQFQFDAPAQAGAIYTAGYSLCANQTIALGSTTSFFQCKSGAFWNLYDRSWAPQCDEVLLAAYPCGSTSGPAASQISDGQVVGTQVVTTTLVKPIADGQPQVITTVVPVPMCQIGDGQVQAHTIPCASVTAAPSPPASSPPAPVSQYTDGQIQVTPPGGVPPPPATTAPSVPSPPPPPPPSAPNSTVSLSTSSPPTPAAPTTPPPSSAPPATSGAWHVQTASLIALVAGLVGAVVFL